VRGRNAATPNTRIKLFFVDTAFLAMTTFAVGTRTQLNGHLQLTSPLEPLRQGVTASEIFDEMIAHEALRSESLLDYSARRTYQVVDLRGNVDAEEVGWMEYRAPERKTFAVRSEKGSGLIRHLALKPLISREIRAAAGKEHQDSAISPANYILEPLGEQQVGPYGCFVLRAIPKRRDKHLFEGKVWVAVEDYAVVRIEGHPAKKPSFWIVRADFVRQFQKIGSFWLPQRDMTFVQVRFYGKKAVTIDHQDYSLNCSITSNVDRR
jgi:hypothetical protein